MKLSFVDALSVEALSVEALSVDALSVEVFIRWSTYPLMDIICWSIRDIRWSFVSYPLKVFNIRWHFFTYTKLQGMKYLQLALLFAYPLVVNMTDTFLQHLRITTWIQRMKCATILHLFLSKTTPSTDSQTGLIRWGYKH